MTTPTKVSQACSGGCSVSGPPCEETCLKLDLADAFNRAVDRQEAARAGKRTPTEPAARSGPTLAQQVYAGRPRAEITEAERTKLTTARTLLDDVLDEPAKETAPAPTEDRTAARAGSRTLADAVYAERARPRAEQPTATRSRRRPTLGELAREIYGGVS